MSDGPIVPGFWMNESTGVLRPAILAYLENRPLTVAHIGAWRSYLRQWMDGPWHGPDIENLRAMIDTIASRHDIDVWLFRALDSNIDPL
jgi:hypothetical protein